MTRRRSTVPMFPGSWLLGSARRLQRDQLATYTEALRTLGDYVRFRVGPPRLGFVFDAVFRPEGARQILASRQNHFVKEASAFTELRSLIGDGLLTAEGEKWRRHRRILQPLFTKQRVAGWGQQLTDASRALADDLEWQRTGGGSQSQPRDAPGDTADTVPAEGSIDLADVSMRYAMRALGGTLFGGHDIEAALPVLRPAVELLNGHAARRALAPVRLPRSLPTPANRRAARARRRLYTLVGDLIRRRRDEPGEGDLLSLLLAAQDPETGERFDDATILDEVVQLLIVGHETTGTALALTLHLLGRHPEVQERIRAEVAHVADERPPVADDLDQLAYTTQVVDEALRLYPPGHALVRTAGEDTELLGCPVRRGQIVTVSVWGIHRNPDVWPDPERFDPDRFDPARTAERDRHAHLPFGAGPRTCIGVHLALAELVLAVATVVRTYRLTSLDDSPAIDTGLTMHPAGPMPCRIAPLGVAEA